MMEDLVKVGLGMILSFTIMGLILWLGHDIGQLEGYNRATRELQVQAIELGIGEWTIDRDGNREFKWFEKKLDNDQ